MEKKDIIMGNQFSSFLENTSCPYFVHIYNENYKQSISTNI
jgi:hypothetical protein